MAKSKKTIKKRFISVDIPILNKEIEILGSGIKDLDGRTIKLDLTHDLKGRAIDLKLLVKADDEKAIANPIELKLFQSYMKRMVRKGTDYSEDSIKTNCKDEKIIIKPLMITRKRVTRSVLRGLREIARKEITDYVSKKNFETILSEILSGDFQKEIQPKLKKVYPLSLFEIKFMGIDKKEVYEEEDEKETKEEVKE
ncbi:hypothetical protein CMI46_03395 [Candidatus Pacearchaeota archaeon]|nr:hypothetical protein [Candidatus Pacearchaeota archaeon]|tara:strand:+ start:2826 stop:3416 length:591 start_codon:yes stop_codon:yes gene_type:complete